jgi:hypothetical protein
MRRLCALVVGAILSGFAFLLVTGDYINEGPVLVDVMRGHGLHAGDMLVMAGWALAMVSLILLTRTSRRLHSS